MGLFCYTVIAESWNTDILKQIFYIVWAPGGSIRPYSPPRNMAKDCRERICRIRKRASTIRPSDEERTYFLTTFLIHPDFVASNVGINDRINVELSDAVIKNLTDKEQTIIHLSRRNPSITVSEIAVFMGVSAKTAERAIKSLKEKEIIVRKGAKRNGKWIILKYGQENHYLQKFH